jgi:predicted permease
MIYVNIMAPVVLLITAGFLARRYLGIEAPSLSKLTLNVLSPALVLNSLANSSLPAQHLVVMAGGVIILFAIQYVMVIGLARAAGLRRSETSAMNLMVLFMNLGNFGLPIVQFVYGVEGLERAVVMVAAQQILVYTVGVMLAGSSHLNWRQAVKAVVSMPNIYAIILGLYLHSSHTQLPMFVGQPVAILAQAANPMFLLVLGVQLASTRFVPRLKLISVATVLRLGVGPALAVALGVLLRMPPESLKVFVVEMGAPTAVTSCLLALEYNAEADLVSSATLVTTLLAVLTVPAIIALVGRL